MVLAMFTRGASAHVMARLFGAATLATAAFGASHACAADLTVVARGIVSGPGAIRVALYRGAEGFRHEDRALRVLSVPARATTIAVTFHDIPPGRYAVLAYHDANDDKKLDLRFGMFPKEGWGLSNDPRVMGPPSFAASALDVTGAAMTTTITMHY